MILLTAFISTSQISVETKLDKSIEEVRQGRKGGSIVWLQTVDSLSADDRAAWRAIRIELEDIGVSVAAFEAKRYFILKWFVRIVATGAFDENYSDEESNYNDEQALRSLSCDAVVKSDVVGRMVALRMHACRMNF